MAETASGTDSETVELGLGSVERARKLLWVVYVAVPVVAGLDKFTNLLVDWTTYLPAAIPEAVGIAPRTVMYVVGVVEIVAGLLVLARARIGALIVAAWLVALAVVLAAQGAYDVAVRDLVMAVGAVALAELAAAADLG